MPVFRSQLVLEEQRRLYDVWLDAAQGGPMPTRQAFQPKAFAALLPWVSLVDRSGDDGLRVRVAGSQLRDVLEGEPLSTLLCPQRSGGTASFEAAFTAAVPGCGACFRPGLRDGGVMRLWLRLPLAAAGAPDRVEAVLGLDVALTRARVPDWALSRIAV